VSVAWAVALLVAVSEKKAQVAFPGHNGKIAYTEYDSYPDEDREIYTMNPDGTDRKQLTDNSANEFAPDVSPYGKMDSLREEGRRLGHGRWRLQSQEPQQDGAR
jgi:Tol biopolymer transport system component